MPDRAPGDVFQIVNQTEGPPPRAWSKLYDYDANSNLIYEGFAQSANKDSEWTVGSGALVNITVAANVATATFLAAHGLEVGHIISVDRNQVDTDLNKEGYVIATVPLATTITFPTVNVADGVYSNVSLVLRTRAPRKTDSVWAIKKYEYDGTNRLIAVKWGEAKTLTQNLIWNSRTTYGYQ